MIKKLNFSYDKKKDVYVCYTPFDYFIIYQDKHLFFAVNEVFGFDEECSTLEEAKDKIQEFYNSLIESITKNKKVHIKWKADKTELFGDEVSIIKSNEYYCISFDYKEHGNLFGIDEEMLFETKDEAKKALKHILQINLDQVFE